MIEKTREIAGFYEKNKKTYTGGLAIESIYKKNKVEEADLLDSEDNLVARFKVSGGFTKIIDENAI